MEAKESQKKTYKDVHQHVLQGHLDVFQSGWESHPSSRTKKKKVPKKILNYTDTTFNHRILAIGLKPFSKWFSSIFRQYLPTKDESKWALGDKYSDWFHKSFGSFLVARGQVLRSCTPGTLLNGVALGSSNWTRQRTWSDRHLQKKSCINCIFGKFVGTGCLLPLSPLFFSCPSLSFPPLCPFNSVSTVEVFVWRVSLG